MALAQQRTTSTGARRPQAFSARVPRALRASLPAGVRGLKRERACVVRAAEPEVQEVALGKAAEAAAPDSGDWVPVCRPEDVPKGVRKEFDVGGLSVLVFWYRNQLYAIESRSPAEGAYAEGFIKAKFTQDYAIECPSTGSLFSLKDGSIVSWYPGNPVLRALTPASTCRTLEIYPVKITQDAISIDTSSARLGARAGSGRGGAGTSLENNNIFTVQPTVYFEGQDPNVESASLYSTGPAGKLDAATVTVGILAVGILGVAGTATALYYESVGALVAFWVVLGGAAAFFGFNYVNSTVKEN